MLNLETYRRPTSGQAVINIFVKNGQPDPQGSQPGCGLTTAIGWPTSSPSTYFNTYGLIVVSESCAKGAATTVAHELGHVLGAHHNRAATDLDVLHSFSNPLTYNYGYIAPDGSYGDVMAYIDVNKIVPYFSSSLISLPNGRSLGDYQTDSRRRILEILSWYAGRELDDLKVQQQQKVRNVLNILNTVIFSENKP